MFSNDTARSARPHPSMRTIVRIEIMTWNRVTALEALRSGDLLELGMSANQTRLKLHREGIVTYALRGTASSENGVVHDLPRDEDGSISIANISGVEEASLDTLKQLLVALHEHLPGVTFQQLPISRRYHFAQNLIALAKTIPAIQSVGLTSINLELLPTQPSAFSSEDLAKLLRAAAECRLFVSASFTIGNGESLEARIEMLEMLRAVQESSKAIQVAVVRVQHFNTPDARREEEATAVDYLKTLAITRLYLDNIEHLQTDWSVMGPKVLELALRFGANDAGTVPRSQAGSKEPSHHGGEAELRRIIRDAGFQPVERDAFFRQSLLH
jgi:cyclic dehypoxanthinyl futalosine synthase